MLSNHNLQNILLEKTNGFVHISLNRPKALNALTLDMTRVISIIVEDSRECEECDLIYIDGQGDRAFCAGGDLKSLYSHGMAFRKGMTEPSVAQIFFTEEYILNSKIKNFPKPYIAFLNGITMGGGYGVSGHGSDVIACEKTVFAMPETKIGFFPDIGATFNFARIKEPFGLYLALTGTSISGEDMLWLGLCNAFIPSAKKAALEEKMKANPQDYKQIIADFDISAERQNAPLKRYEEQIIKHFSHETVEDMIESLASDTSEWAVKTRAELDYACPISLRVTLEQMKRVREKSFDFVMKQDLALATRFIRGHDLYEGIKAMVIEKTKMPQWDPKTLADIDDQDVLKYFEGVE